MPTNPGCYVEREVPYPIVLVVAETVLPWGVSASVTSLVCVVDGHGGVTACIVLCFAC